MLYRTPLNLHLHHLQVVRFWLSSHWIIWPLNTYKLHTKDYWVAAIQRHFYTLSHLERIYIFESTIPSPESETRQKQHFFWAWAYLRLCIIFKVLGFHDRSGLWIKISNALVFIAGRVVDGLSTGRKWTSNFIHCKIAIKTVLQVCCLLTTEVNGLTTGIPRQTTSRTSRMAMFSLQRKRIMEKLELENHGFVFGLRNFSYVFW
jgi:hypothetical protein